MKMTTQKGVVIMVVTLYNVASDVKTIDRPLGSGVSYSGDFVGPLSQTTPDVLIDVTPNSHIGNFNYCQIDGYFYWITEPIAERTGLVRIRCRRDPLKSFAGQIKALPAIAGRASGDTYNSYLSDPQQKLNASDIAGTIVVTSFTYGNGYVLVTAG